MLWQSPGAAGAVAACSGPWLEHCEPTPTQHFDLSAQAEKNAEPLRDYLAAGEAWMEGGLHLLMINSFRGTKATQTHREAWDAAMGFANRAGEAEL